MTVEPSPLGQLIRERREELGWNQRDLAERIQVTQATIQAWETKQAVTSIRSFASLAEHLDIDRYALYAAGDRVPHDLDADIRTMTADELHRLREAVNTILAPDV